MLISSASYANASQPAGAVSRQIASLLQAARAAFAQRPTRVALEELDEHLLRDVGLSRFQPVPDPFAISIDCSSWR